MTSSESQPRTRSDNFTCGWCGDELDLEDITGHLYSEGIRPPWEAEAAQDSRPLDVERLAKAMRSTGIAEQYDGTPWNDGTLKRVTEDLAAEYTRLAEDP